jgi:GT2 family glycosyltransferase
VTVAEEIKAAPEQAIGNVRPIVSVIVASCRERRLLDACLRSLEAQCREYQAEIVVSRASSPSEIQDLREKFPSVRFVAAPMNRTIPQLRAEGIAAAEADVIALTEDHCVVAGDWLGKLTRAVEHGALVAGGAMDNAQRNRAIDWAAYFAEYGFFAINGGGRPLRPLLTAANVAYSRRVVHEVIKQAKEGEWENVIHAQLFAQGRSFQFVRSATVYQNKTYRFWEFCHDRFVHGRDYARRRLVDGATRRWLYFAGSFVLPIVLTMRVAQTVGRHHRWPFLRALPITFAFLTAWAAGEAVGYWYGPPLPGTDRA